jgi:hypothetical protein
VTKEAAAPDAHALTSPDLAHTVHAPAASAVAYVLRPERPAGSVTCAARLDLRCPGSDRTLYVDGAYSAGVPEVVGDRGRRCNVYLAPGRPVVT